MSEPTLREADIPIIDIADLSSPDSSRRTSVARQIADANARIGFLVITGHGVPQALIHRMHAVSEEFFALPEPIKSSVQQPDTTTSRGYVPPRARSLAASGTGMGEKDFVEYFAAGPDHRTGSGVFDHRNIWPETPTTFRQVWTDYFSELERVGNALLRGFALGLDMPENYFESFCDDHCSVLFANGYPPVSTAPTPGKVRLGQHTDYGSLTILYRDENPSGLQVWQDEQWRHVPDIPGSFVVNIGDLMARWTNDRWVSTLHRVANPPAASYGKRRISIPYFHQPNADAVIEAIPTCVGPGNPTRYEPITSGQNYLDKTRRSVLTSPAK
nr:2-oxoglutarate and iron-dependent oxygenase domain-containing protein [uncultured Rhodococcus sp.]